MITDFNLAPLDLVPEWMQRAGSLLKEKYPNDSFEVVYKKDRNTEEYRIKCTDCQGKLYQTGSGQTFSNFEIHLRSLMHRQAVERRLFDQEDEA